MVQVPNFVFEIYLKNIYIFILEMTEEFIFINYQPSIFYLHVFHDHFFFFWRQNVISEPFFFHSMVALNHVYHRQIALYYKGFISKKKKEKEIVITMI